MPDHHIISVHPRWARKFFLPIDPKTIELRKIPFGTSLKPGGIIVIYSTLPEGVAIGTVQVIKRKAVQISELWQQSQNGELAKVSESEFQAYYGSEDWGVGIWVEKAERWEREVGLIELRERLGDRWQPPQQAKKLPEGFLSDLGNHR